MKRIFQFLLIIFFCVKSFVSVSAMQGSQEGLRLEMGNGTIIVQPHEVLQFLKKNCGLDLQQEWLNIGFEPVEAAKLAKTEHAKLVKLHAETDDYLSLLKNPIFLKVLLEQCSDRLKKIRENIVKKIDAFKFALPQQSIKTIDFLNAIGFKSKTDNADMVSISLLSELFSDFQNERHESSVQAKPLELLKGLCQVILQYFDETNLQKRIDNGDSYIFECPYTPIFLQKSTVTPGQIKIITYPSLCQDSFVLSKKFDPEKIQIGSSNGFTKIYLLALTLLSAVSDVTDTIQFVKKLNCSSALTAQTQAENDLIDQVYRVLEIPRGEKSLKVIAKRYRYLAKQFHPDICHTAECAIKMQEINSTYEVLIKSLKINE